MRMWKMTAAALSALSAALPHAVRAQDGPAVKLGVLTDLAGPYSDLTGRGSVLATRMAVEDCQAAECRGMTIQVEVADHGNKADIALVAARAWIDNAGVDALVDMSHSAIQLAVAPFAAEKNRVALFAGGTARLTGDQCQPEHIVQWIWDTYAQVGGVSHGLTRPGTTWFLIASDYALGYEFEANARAIIGAAGGRVLGVVRHPFPSSDMASFLLQAQASGADVIALANAGTDTTNAIKQAREFGIGTGKQKLVAFFLNAIDVKAVGLPAAAGTVLTEGFYWDLDEGTRAFSRRFLARHTSMPSATHAGVYSAVRHYLKAVAATRSTDARTVLRTMRATPVADEVVRNAELRSDGRLTHDYYTFQVKQPKDSRGAWDLYTLLGTASGQDAFRSVAAGGCPRLTQ